MRGKSFRRAGLLVAVLALAPGAAWAQFGAAGYAPGVPPLPLGSTRHRHVESPVSLVEFFFGDARPNVPLPEGGEDWDYLGTFRLVEGGKAFTVCLYAQDTDSTAAKYGFFIYPNSFSLHAMYSVGTRDWAHKELYGAGRVRFSRVVKVKPAAVMLELCPNFRISLDPNEPADRVLKRAAEINKPFTERLRIVGGVPTMR
jgi:hypothetical protein